MRFPVYTRPIALAFALGLAGIISAPGTATAEPSIILDVDDAKLVKIPGEPSAVVVSNPMFADASVQGNKLILVGKNTGKTKIIVLDHDGNQLANMFVKVQREEQQSVSVYRAGSRTTLACNPFCDRQLTVNDNLQGFKAQSESIELKNGFSTGAAATGGGNGN